MAKIEDPWKRLREREDEENEVQLSDRSKGSANAGTAKLLELLHRAEPLIEQVNNLYNQYLAGAEKTPPIERRAQLDQLMNTISIIAKPTAALQFRANTLISQFTSYRERWERALKRLEVGKIKRTQE